MRKGLLSLVVAFVAIFAFACLAQAQEAQGTQANQPVRKNPYVGMPVDGWTNQPVKPPVTSRPAPRRDISGIWDPGNGGIQAMGAAASPEDGKPGHDLPYTPEGLAALKLTKPSNGVRSVLPEETNDPVVACNPQGLPTRGSLRAENHSDSPNTREYLRLVRVWPGMASHLDRWARLPQGCRAEVVRLFDWQLGGRLHVRRGNHGHQRRNLDRPRGPAARSRSARRGAIPSRGPRYLGTHRDHHRSQDVHQALDSLESATV